MDFTDVVHVGLRKNGFLMSAASLRRHKQFSRNKPLHFLEILLFASRRCEANTNNGVALVLRLTLILAFAATRALTLLTLALTLSCYIKICLLLKIQFRPCILPRCLQALPQNIVTSWCSADASRHVYFHSSVSTSHSVSVRALSAAVTIVGLSGVWWTL